MIHFKSSKIISKMTIIWTKLSKRKSTKKMKPQIKEPSKHFIGFLRMIVGIQGFSVFYFIFFTKNYLRVFCLKSFIIR